MRDAARFQRQDVRPRHVGAVAREAAEQETDVSGLNRNKPLTFAWFETQSSRARTREIRERGVVRRPFSRFRRTPRHSPSALLNEPLDVSPDSVGERFFNG